MGTVDKFREEFELLSRVMKNIPEPILEGNFRKGLRPDIQAKVCALAPGNLKEIMIMAQRIKNKIHSLQELGVGHKIQGARHLTDKISSRSNPGCNRMTKVTYFRRHEGGARPSHLLP